MIYDYKKKAGDIHRIAASKGHNMKHVVLTKHLITMKCHMCEKVWTSYEYTSLDFFRMADACSKGKPS